MSPRQVYCDIGLDGAILSTTQMQIRVDTDDHIDSSEELTIRVRGVVEGSVDRFQDRLTLVEVHLSRLLLHPIGGRDMCCRIEAHAGTSTLKPIVVSHEAVTLTEAIHAASAKLERAVHAALGGVRSKDATAPAAAEAADPAEGLGHLKSS
jgi:ribosome-associated translation inhibitor RaiA